MDPEASAGRPAWSARTAPAAEPVEPGGPEVPVGPEPAETVLIQVPADPDYLPVIRSASAHVGTKLGATLAEVSDLRLAVDEACGLLLRHTERDWRADGAGDLECRFVLDGATLRVLLSLQGRGADRPEADEFGWTILSALVDEIDWRVDGPTVHVEILKRRTAGR